MNNAEAMNWQTFKNKLLQYPDLRLQFLYGEGKLVDAAYHITEIKQAPVTSVDCGGVMNKWTEIIVQLWVPGNTKQDEPMKVSKALSIITTVEKMLSLDLNGMVKIEFGNSEFDTRQMLPHEMTAEGDSLFINLQPDAVQCKATARGGSCGTEKPKIQLVNLAAPADACCTPGGGCC